MHVAHSTHIENNDRGTLGMYTSHLIVIPVSSV